jgi:hypothetical protein
VGMEDMVNLVNDAFSLSEIRAGLEDGQPHHVSIDGHHTNSRSNQLSKRHARRLSLTPTGNIMPIEMGGGSGSAIRGSRGHGSFSEKEFPRSELPQLFEWSPPPFSKLKEDLLDHPHIQQQRNRNLMSDSSSSANDAGPHPRHGHHTRNRQGRRSHSAGPAPQQISSTSSAAAAAGRKNGSSSEMMEPNSSTSSSSSVSYSEQDEMNMHSDSSSLAGSGGGSGGSSFGVRTYLTPHQGRRLRRRQPEDFSLKATLTSPDFDPTSGALNLLSPTTGSSLSDFESVAQYMDQGSSPALSPKPSPMASPINVGRPKRSQYGNGGGNNGVMSPQSPWRSPTASSSGLHALLSASHDERLNIYGSEEEEEEDEEDDNAMRKPQGKRNNNYTKNNNNGNVGGINKLGCLTPSPCYPHSLIEDGLQSTDIEGGRHVHHFDDRRSLFSPLTSPALSDIHLGHALSPGFLSPMEFASLHSPGLVGIGRGASSHNIANNFSCEKSQNSSSSSSSSFTLVEAPSSTTKNPYPQYSSNNNNNNNNYNNGINNENMNPAAGGGSASSSNQRFLQQASSPAPSHNYAATSPSQLAWSNTSSKISAPSSMASVGAKPPPGSANSHFHSGSGSGGGASAASSSAFSSSSHHSHSGASSLRGPMQSFAMSPPLSLKNDFLTLLADSSPFPVKNMKKQSSSFSHQGASSSNSSSNDLSPFNNNNSCFDNGSDAMPPSQLSQGVCGGGGGESAARQWSHSKPSSSSSLLAPKKQPLGDANVNFLESEFSPTKC